MHDLVHSCDSSGVHCSCHRLSNVLLATQPTERSRHIDIQFFAIQDWKDAIEHVPGVINLSDDLTEPLGWVLHSRHALRQHVIVSEDVLVREFSWCWTLTSWCHEHITHDGIHEFPQHIV